MSQRSIIEDISFAFTDFFQVIDSMGLPIIENLVHGAVLGLFGVHGGMWERRQLAIRIGRRRTSKSKSGGSGREKSMGVANATGILEQARALCTAGEFKIAASHHESAWQTAPIKSN
jgi:hypothetical protein